MKQFCGHGVSSVILLRMSLVNVRYRQNVQLGESTQDGCYLCVCTVNYIMVSCMPFVNIYIYVDKSLG